MIASSQIGLVSFRVGCVASRDLLLLIAGQFQAQLAGNLPGYFLLDCQDVQDFAVILLAPELRARRRIDQIYLNVQGVAQLSHPSHHHRTDIEITTNLLRINLFPLVTESRAAPGDPQPLKLREAVDQALADAIRNVLRVRIGAGIGEGQHRD